MSVHVVRIGRPYYGGVREPHHVELKHIRTRCEYGIDVGYLIRIMSHDVKRSGMLAIPTAITFDCGSCRQNRGNEENDSEKAGRFSGLGSQHKNLPKNVIWGNNYLQEREQQGGVKLGSLAVIRLALVGSHPNR